MIVVTAILALLLALLMPSLRSAHEAARRAGCASNQRQVVVSELAHAVDHFGSFRTTRRTAGGTDHVSWTSAAVYHSYKEHGLDLRQFVCPSRRDDYIGEPASAWRTGYYLLFGRNTAGWAMSGYTHSYELNPWASPQQLTSPGDGVMMGDVIETGTWSPAETSASHGPAGLIRGPQYSDPGSIGSEGGNLAYIDGSAGWRPQAQMKSRAASSGGDVLGWW